MSLSQNQLNERLNYICGSDAAVICGVSPYANHIELWQEKTRQITPKDISHKACIKAGNFLEPAVRSWFEAETGLKVTTDDRLIVHDKIPFMAGHIDGWVGTDSIFEAKTSSYDYGWGETGTGDIPDHYLCQVAHYMAVCDVKKAYVAVLIRGTDFRFYVIERNMKLEEMLIRKQEEFWECVKKNYPPRILSGQEVISLHGYKSVEESLVATGEISELLINLRDIRLEEDRMSKTKKDLEDKIKVFMGEKDTLLDLSGKIAVIWKSSKPTKRFDATRFKEDNEREYSKYVKECSASRRFLIKQEGQ
jgi:putative phage-type endonuclease